MARRRLDQREGQVLLHPEMHVGFFEDFFGPPKPCDLCQLGKVSWPPQHSASRDWRLWGHGLRVTLLLCRRCYQFVRRSGLEQNTPLLALATLNVRGVADRPPPHAYLQHPEWKKIWMHMLESGGFEIGDDFAALACIREIEPAFFKQVEGGVTSPLKAQVPPVGGEGKETMEILKQISWGASKDAVRRLFASDAEIPPHPTQNAIGFLIEVYGTPTVVVCYFRKSLLRDKLARVNITPFAEGRPSDSEAEALYHQIQRDLLEQFGEPMEVADTLDAPPEFRQSKLFVWKAPGSVLMLSLALLRDGIAESTPALAVGFGDAAHDPASRPFA